MPLPYPEAFQEGVPVSSKAFAARREVRRTRVKQMTNLLVATANFFELGAPRGGAILDF